MYYLYATGLVLLIFHKNIITCSSSKKIIPSIFFPCITEVKWVIKEHIL